MKKITAVVIGAVFACIAVNSAQASGDEGYEHHERYEYGNHYYNPYGYTNHGSNNAYRDHERYEYGNRNMNYVPRYNNYNYGNTYNGSNGYRYNNNYGNYGSNNAYRDHERYEYRR